MKNIDTSDHIDNKYMYNVFIHIIHTYNVFLFADLFITIEFAD